MHSMIIAHIESTHVHIPTDAAGAGPDPFSIPEPNRFDCVQDCPSHFSVWAQQVSMFHEL